MGWQRSNPSTAPGGDADIAAVGALVADPARCRILLALGDGRELPASRLAADAGVSPATASSHLAKLTSAGFLAVEARGRFRHYRLAGPEVGALIEALERIAPPAPVRSLHQSHRAHALRTARTCYDHLAGRLGVDLMRTLVERGYLVGEGVEAEAAGAALAVGPGARYDHEVDYALSDQGRAFLDGLGVQVSPGRRLVRHHVDGTEGRPHLAGAIGSGLLDCFIELRWLKRSGDSRATDITPAGRQGFDEHFGIPLGI